MWYNLSIKLAEWARQNGITYQTAWKWWKAGKLPVPARQMPTGTILVEAPEREDVGAVLYARVASADPRSDLARQVARWATRMPQRVAYGSPRWWPRSVVGSMGTAKD